MIRADPVPQREPPAPVSRHFTQKRDVRASAASEKILLDHPVKAHHDIASIARNDPGSGKRKEQQTPRAWPGRANHPVRGNSAGRRDRHAAAKKMNVMTSVPESLGGAIVNSFRPSSQIKSVMD